ncbi:MAG: oligosaccharide flippase family protein [Gemmatimonadota bacterium]|nr:oligosaccharide flippase family protein [Gemmatimonadota bacterium]
MGTASAVAFAAGIVRQKVFAVYLGPEGLGLYGVLASLFDLAVVLVLVGAPAGLLREASALVGRGDPQSVRVVVRSVRGVLFGVAGLFIVGAFIFGARIAGRFELPDAWVFVLSLGLPAVVLAATSEAVLNAFGRIRRLAAAKVTTTLVSLVVMVALVTVLGLHGSLIQIVTGAWVAALVSVVALRGVVSGAAPGKLAEHVSWTRVLRPVFALGVAQIVMHGAANFNQFIFRSLLVLGEGEVAGGLYQGAMGLSRQYTAAFSAALYVYAYPRLSRRSSDPTAAGRELARVFRFLLALGLPAALVLLAGRDVLVAAVFTADFEPMVPLLAWSLAVDPFQICVLVLAFAVLATSSPMASLVLGLLYEATYLTVFAWGVTGWGVLGAVGAYGVATAAGLILYGGYLMGRRGVPLPPSVVVRFVVALAAAGAASRIALTPGGRLAMLALAAAWMLFHRQELSAAFRA